MVQLGNLCVELRLGEVARVDVAESCASRQSKVTNLSLRARRTPGSLRLDLAAILRRAQSLLLTSNTEQDPLQASTGKMTNTCVDEAHRQSG